MFHLHTRVIRTLVAAAAVALMVAADARGATRHVPAGGDLQGAINAAQPGDTITLEPGALYVGNFRLPVHAGSEFITIRSAASDASLPQAGVRITPADAANLPKLKSLNTVPVIATAPGAAYWKLMFLELQSTYRGYYDIVTLGDGSEAQNSLDQLPHDLVLDRLYIHGDPLHGQKRGISLNSGRTSIINSHISGIRGIGQDTVAVGGWNGPGPYLIENNYLEAAGEVVIFGGSLPAIRNVVPSDIVIRGNTITRPLLWREPVIGAPSGVRAVTVGGGSLPAGTYGYRVVARRPAYDTEAVSAPSTEVTVTVSANSSVQLSWSPVPDAAEYLVYGRTPGNESSYWVVQGTALIENGGNPDGAGGPGAPTLWQVKNLLELKNARRVQIDHNNFSNNWLQAQIGVAFLFTPRSEEGACNWCGVEDVTFEYNVIRRVGAGFNILGFDDTIPSLQTNNIRIRHNEISDFGYPYDGSGYFVMLQGNPRDITVDHNTIVTSTGSGVIQIGGPPISGFVFTNNVARHNSYGIIGSGLAPGFSTIDALLPGAIIRRNALAGGDPSIYPADNLFPSGASFDDHFRDPLHGDFSLKPGTDWANAGTDGLDLGAIFTRPTLPVTLSAPQNLRQIQ
jgi:hypothetical protein